MNRLPISIFNFMYSIQRLVKLLIRKIIKSNLIRPWPGVMIFSSLPINIFYSLMQNSLFSIQFLKIYFSFIFQSQSYALCKICLRSQEEVTIKSSNLSLRQSQDNFLLSKNLIVYLLSWETKGPNEFDICHNIELDQLDQTRVNNNIPQKILETELSNKKSCNNVNNIQVTARLKTILCNCQSKVMLMNS